ncbi:MAG: hypothetical protein ACODAJ_05285 [Planctomycetota bacterium]
MARMETGTDLAEQLTESYAMEAGLYERLLDLSRRQGALLADSGDVDACAGLFELKDELLKALADIEECIEPLKRRWWDEQVEPAVRERLNTQLDQILETIEALMEQEHRNEQLLLQCSNEVQAELGHCRQGSAMHQAQADAAPIPRFMDISR